MVNGTIVPLEPVPQEWNDGTQLIVEKSDEFASDSDRWAKLNELCAEGDDEEDARLQEFLNQRRNEEKQIMRKIERTTSTPSLVEWLQSCPDPGYFEPILGMNGVDLKASL